MTDTVKFHRLCADNLSLLEGTTVFGNPVDSTQLANFAEDLGHEMVFAWTGARVVGFASGAVLLHPDKPPEFFINEVGVEEDMRQQGLATTLVKMLHRIAWDKGCQGVWLATETDNTAARGLYQKLNARETGAVVIYDWDGAKNSVLRTHI